MKGKLFILALAVAAFACIMIMPEASAGAGDDYEMVEKDGILYKVNTATNTAMLFSVEKITSPDLVIPDVIPETTTLVTAIDEGAVNLPGIKTVKIGNNIVEIEDDAFGSVDITEFIEPDTPTVFTVDDGVLYKEVGPSNALVRYPSAKPGDYFRIDAWVTELYGGAFSECKNLVTIDFEAGSGITEIPTSAFFNCTKLSDMNFSDGYNHLPDKVILIENSAFYGCSALKSMKFPDNLRLIEAYAFHGSGAQKFYLNWDLYFIGVLAFANCSNLTAFEAENDVIYTGSGQFQIVDGILFEIGGSSSTSGSSSTKKIVCYPAGKTETSYTFPEKTTHIAWGAFSGCKYLKEVTISEGVSVIDTSAFEDCTALTTVNLAKSVTILENNAFCGCTSLTTINGMTNVADIGSNALSRTAITELKLPDSIRTIRYNAFAESKLVKLTVPDVAVNIQSDAILGCIDLKDIYFEGDRMELDAGSMNVGTDADHKAEFTVHLISTANIPSDAVNDEFTTMHIDKEGEHPYPYENFIGVAICLLALFGVVMVIREV